MFIDKYMRSVHNLRDWLLSQHTILDHYRQTIGQPLERRFAVWPICMLTGAFGFLKWKDLRVSHIRVYTEVQKLGLHLRNSCLYFSHTECLALLCVTRLNLFQSRLSSKQLNLNST